MTSIKYATTPTRTAATLNFSSQLTRPHRHLHSFPTRRSSDLPKRHEQYDLFLGKLHSSKGYHWAVEALAAVQLAERSEEHTSELQSPDHLVCRLLLEKKEKAANCSSQEVALQTIAESNLLSQ